jgi:hypothetical protein
LNGFGIEENRDRAALALAKSRFGHAAHRSYA